MCTRFSNSQIYQTIDVRMKEHPYEPVPGLLEKESLRISYETTRANGIGHRTYSINHGRRLYCAIPLGQYSLCLLFRMTGRLFHDICKYNAGLQKGHWCHAVAFCPLCELYGFHIMHYVCGGVCLLYISYNRCSCIMSASSFPMIQSGRLANLVKVLSLAVQSKK